MAQEPTRCVHVFVSGYVQGVFYRASTLDKAKELGLLGWVRNLPDGRVEIVAEGPEQNIQQLLAWCRQGPAYSRVDRIEVEELTPEGTHDDFSVHYA